MSMLQAVKIKEGVYWVGAIDWNIRDYHGYTLPGTTYNAYLVLGEKVALIDGTYPGHEWQMIERIESVIPLEKIDYIVANHIEIDHSGSLPMLAKKLPNVPIYMTEIAKKGFARHYDTEGWNIHTIKNLENLELGGKTLTFLEAPFLHWPDSMFTYLGEDKVLFPNDAFGQHIASSARFDDELGIDVALEHAAKFVANLIVPLSPKVLKKLGEVTELGVPIEMIAPSHGIIWRSHAADIINAYVNWAKGVSKNKITIVYDTMHYSTGTAAQYIAEGAISEGVEVKFDLLKDGRYEGVHRSDVVRDILDSKAVIVGSPTLEDYPLPTVAGFLYYLAGIRPGKQEQKKIGFAFGSNGGKGGAPKVITELMQKAGIEIWHEPVEFTYRPQADDKEKFFKLGQEIAKAVKQMP